MHTTYAGGEDMIRHAEIKDVARMLEIYAPYVEDTAISFEYDAPSLEAFRNRFERISARYPWIVWEDNGRVVGYAYADTAFERAAYRWDADMSVYVDLSERGKGIGTLLYDCLENLLTKLGYCNLYALVTADNLPSCRFHEGRGYALNGVLKRSGYKFGKWYDVNWYCLNIPGNDPEMGEPGCFDRAMMADYR